MTLPIVIAALTVLLMLGIGGSMTTIGPWYRDLRKPAWNPPNWIFGPAWTTILGLAAWAGVLAWTNASSSTERVRILVLFGINIVLYVLWTPCSSICGDPIGPLSRFRFSGFRSSR